MHEITRTDVFTDADRVILLGWSDDPFQANRYKIDWRPKQLHLIIRENEQPISKVSLLEHEVSVGDHVVKVGGVGGVITVPEARGRGLARLLLSHANEVMRAELEVPFGFLFCLDHMLPFYESLGWQRVEPVYFEQESGRVLSPVNAMILPLRDEAWPGGEIDLRSKPW